MSQNDRNESIYKDENAGADAKNKGGRPVKSSEYGEWEQQTIRLPRKYRAKIKEQASSEGMSISDYVFSLIKCDLASRGLDDD